MRSIDVSPSSDTYEIVVSCSPVYECALGIGAYTWSVVADKLERTPDEWRAYTDGMAQPLRALVERAGQIHTWRNLLFLAHRAPGLMETPQDQHMSVFLEWIAGLSDELPALAAPYLGMDHAQQLEDALAGSEHAKAQLLQRYDADPVLRPNLQYLFEVSAQELLTHLYDLLTGWYGMIVRKREMTTALVSDRNAVLQLAATVPVKELVRQVTRGLEMQPEPMVRRIWFVPQMAYRPLTIYNRLQQTSVYYYPIQDQHMPGDRQTHSAVRVANLHKAVGDVHRVRMLQMLSKSPHSITEMGAVLLLANSTVHHHLALLRAAGLVRVERGLYEVVGTEVRKLGPALTMYLGMGDENS